MAVFAAFLGALVSLAVATLVFRSRENRRRALAAYDLEEKVRKRTASLQEELNRASKLAAVGQLVAGVGHEINNPLAYVLANLELVAEQTPTSDPDLTASIVDAKDGVERIRQIVRDLQVFSRTDEAEHMIDVQQVLQRSIRMAKTQVKHAANLVVDLRPLPAICANETRLGQVFLNLLVNAAQAIGIGNVAENEIRVRSYTDPQGRAVIEVQDTGPGMTAEVRSKIFQPFFTTKPVGSGTGLGLAICRSIVNALRGDIEVESEPGKGALFRVVLPQPIVRRERKASAPVVFSNKRKRVLVVDDEPLICRAVQKLLTAEHDVVTYSSSKQALDQIRAGERYDVIFCDLMMPELSGIDFYEGIGASAPELLPRVVFMTGGVLNDRTRGFLVGLRNALLEKPLSPKTLRRAVNDVVVH